MDLCQVDVLPTSLFGSPCNRRITNGECPEHGTTRTPDIRARSSEVTEDTIRRAQALLQRINDGEGLG